MEEGILLARAFLGLIAFFGFLFWLNKRGGFKRPVEQTSEAVTSTVQSEFVKKREENEFHGRITIQDTNIKDKKFNGKVEIVEIK